ncbi:MAG: sigma-70 family RNA polymerase sigma factor [Vicinamibacterales bacterium]
MPGDAQAVTDLLLAWRGGDESALERLTPLVYDELHRIARRSMANERPEVTLQATALVNEAFLRLVDVRRVNWQNRAHFLAMVARLMRRVLVDAARARQAEKRGGDAVRVTFDEVLFPGRDPSSELVKLDEALDALAALDERKSRVVELRFFSGLSLDETAEALGVSTKTVMRDWEFAKAWLQREMKGDPRDG